MFRVDRWLASVCLLGSALCLFTGSYRFAQACTQTYVNTTAVAGSYPDGTPTCVWYSENTCLFLYTITTGYDHNRLVSPTITIQRNTWSGSLATVRCQLPACFGFPPAFASQDGSAQPAGGETSYKKECYDDIIIGT